jgi:hypothetical protein
MPVLANAIPKSGTHLLCRTLELLGLGRDGSVRFYPPSGDRYPEQVRYDRDGVLNFASEEVPLAANTVRLVSRARFEAMVEQFATLKALEYCDAHLAWREIVGEAFAKANVKVIIIMREPRSVAWSHVDWIVGKQASHPHKDLFVSLSLRDRLAYEFFGLPRKEQPKWPPFIPLLYRYRNMAGWATYPHLFVTTFESLVGDQGGGSSREQTEEIRAIANFVGVAKFDVEAIRGMLWGKSSTFRIGKVTSWDGHRKALFPSQIEDQLAEMDHIINLLKKRRGGSLLKTASKLGQG